MLALSVRRGQRVRITTPSGEVIWLTLSKSGKGGGTIQFDAARDVAIDREAVVMKKDREATDQKLGVRS